MTWLIVFLIGVAVIVLLDARARIRHHKDRETIQLVAWHLLNHLRDKMDETDLAWWVAHREWFDEPAGQALVSVIKERDPGLWVMIRCARCYSQAADFNKRWDEEL